ncbi:MAG: hypothetical protein NO475_05730 [Candidatus Methanomethylicia archaeon]|nr:hypothetical protein [Candidatus Methanomethylicia archaeon]
MVKKIRWLRIMIKAFIPVFCIYPIHLFSKIIILSLPDLKYHFYVIDIFGFIPSFVLISMALLYLKSQKSKQDMAIKIFRISIFTAITIFLLFKFWNSIYISTGLSFDKPMIILLAIFTFFNAISSLGHSKWFSFLTLISNENSLKENIVSIFSLVGFPLLLIDTIPAFPLGMGVVGGMGLRDGLNIMLITLTFYSLISYLINRLVAIIKI